MVHSATATKTIHASCVEIAENAVLIIGASGSGKSALALQLMAYGGVLVADDQTQIECKCDQLVASGPPQISGKIEARGLGILAAEYTKQAVVGLIVDMDNKETDRLPPKRHTELLKCVLPVVYVSETKHFAAAVVQLLKGGRIA